MNEPGYADPGYFERLYARDPDPWRFATSEYERDKYAATLAALLLHAGADRCVVPAGSAAFASATPRGIVTARAFPALFHELFNEPERAEVLSVLAGWLDTLDVSPARSPP